MKITLPQLIAIAPRADKAILNSIVTPLTRHTQEANIVSPLRMQHFLAQAAHETDGFRVLEEYASGAAYEGRKDLGNVRAGDGKTYKGRGIFMLTGRANYAAYGKRLGLSLEANPHMAANPEISVRIACEYWKAKGLNQWADRDDIREITRRINGGYNGLKDRQTYLDRARKAIPTVHFSAATIAPEPEIEEVPDAPIAAEAPAAWWASPTVLGTIVTSIGGLVGAVNSPWALGAVLVLAIVGGAGVIIWKRIDRQPPTTEPV